MSEHPTIHTKIWTALELLKWGTGYFSEKNIDSPRLTMEIILCEVLECSRVQLYLNYEKPLTGGELAKLRIMTNKRANREPLQYILGKTEFYGLPFFVDSSVLIPRPETEILVELAINNIKKITQESISVLDIGTGSGCIAVTLAKKLPKCRIVAIDVSAGALDIARRNAEANDVDVEFIRRDVLKEMKVKQPFDVIVSNPPYISSDEMTEIEPELALYEPQIALTDGGDGLEFYRRFSTLFNDILSQKGVFFVEIGYNQAEKVEALFSQNFECRIHNDLANIPRVLQGKRKCNVIEM